MDRYNDDTESQHKAQFLEEIAYYTKTSDKAQFLKEIAYYTKRHQIKHIIS